MLVLNSQLENTPVMSLQTGGRLATAAKPIIDPRQLQLVAFYVTGPQIAPMSVLHTSDIREFSSLGFIVDGVDSIMPLDGDLVRLQEIVNFKFSLLGKTVVTEHKKKLGKVVEYVVESDGWFIQKIHVSQSLLKSVTSSNLVIHRSQIIELTDTTIVVRSATVQEPVGLVKALNPFRKSQPLVPEASKIDDRKS